MTDQCEEYGYGDDKGHSASREKRILNGYRIAKGVVIQGGAHHESIEPNETVEPAAELPDWLQAIDPDPTHHHFVEVVQEPAPGHGSQIVNPVAVCTCGWRSGEHQLYRGEYYLG